jgi:hypothetical protein
LSGSFLATLRYDPYVSKGLVRDDHARTQWSAGRLSVELIDDTVGEPRNSGKEAPIVAKEQPECFRHRENELAMRQIEQELLCQMLGKEDCPFSTTGWAEIETLARERPEVIVSALGVGTANPRHALEIVAARRESLAELPDALKTIPAVGCGVLLIVVLAEIIEVLLEDGMQIVPTARHVPFGRDRLRESCCPHIYSYGGNKLPASRNPRNHRWPHNIAHSPDAFSSLRSCEGAGDAVVRLPTTRSF